MPRTVHALVLGLALGMASHASFATPLEQLGSPDRIISVMQNYGVGVPLEQGLKSVVPRDWSTFIHPEVQVDAEMVWKVGQDWPSVLNEYAARNGLSILISWAERAVYVRTPSVALEEGAKRAELALGATTPLPSFSDSKRVPTTIDASSEQMQYVVSTDPAPIAQIVANAAHASQAVTDAPKPIAPASKASSANEDLVKQALNTTLPTGDKAASELIKVSYTADLNQNTTTTSSPSVTEPTKAQPLSDSTLLEVTPANADAKNAVAQTVAAAGVATSTEVTPEQGKQPASGPVPKLTVKEEVIVAAPTAQQAASVAAALSGPALALGQAAPKGPNADFEYKAPVALNKPMARAVVQGIANKYQLRMVWAAPEFQLQGPVTLLGNTAKEDALLLSKALGVFSPIAVDVPAGQGVITVVSKTGYYPPIITNPVPPTLANALPVAEPPALVAVITPVTSVSTASEAQTSTVPLESAPLKSDSVTVTTVDTASPQPMAPVVDVVTTQPAKSAAPAKVDALQTYTLEIHEGEPLEVALVRFTNEHGYSLDWKVQGGFEAKRTLKYTGESISDVLGKVLPPLAISADIYTIESHIIVRPADAVLDR